MDGNLLGLTPNGILSSKWRIPCCLANCPVHNFTDFNSKIQRKSPLNKFNYGGIRNEKIKHLESRTAALKSSALGKRLHR